MSRAARMRAAIAAGASLMLALCPALALACATCGIGNGRNNTEIFWSTIFLSLFPLVMFGVIITWIVRRSRAFIRDEFRDDDEQLLAQADAIRAQQSAASGTGAAGN